MLAPMFAESAELYDLFYDWKDYAGEALRVRGIVEARRPGAATLLDVACGTGRHLEELRDHYEIEGLDLDDGLLEVARRRLAGVRLHRDDMRTFDLHRRYDVVTCLFSSIGYVESVEGLRSAIGAMARHVAPGGLLIVEPWFAPDAFDPNHIGRVVVAERPDLQAVRMNGSRVDERVSELEFHYLIARPGTVEHRTEVHRLGLFTEDEYRDALMAAGLAVEHDAKGLMGRGLWIGTALV
jgi:SAM-dependent methyltransferase